MQAECPVNNGIPSGNSAYESVPLKPPGSHPLSVILNYPSVPVVEFLGVGSQGNVYEGKVGRQRLVKYVQGDPSLSNFDFNLAVHDSYRVTGHTCWRRATECTPIGKVKRRAVPRTRNNITLD